MKRYDVGIDKGHCAIVRGRPHQVAHAVGPYRWPWGWHWRALCGRKVIRFDRPFKPGIATACRDCTRYARGIRA